MTRLGRRRHALLDRERLKRLGRAYVNLLPLLLLLFVALEWNGIPGQPGRDSRAFWAVSGGNASGLGLYQDYEIEGPHEYAGRFPFLYPPPLAAALSLVPPLPYRTFDRLWLVLNALALCIFGATLGRLRDGHYSARGTWLWSAIVFATPGALLAIHFANVTPWIWVLVGVAFAHPRVAGAFLATGAAIKVTPVWPLLAWTLRCPRRLLPPTALAAFVLTGLSVAVFGATELVGLCLVWFDVVLPSVSQGQFWGSSIAEFRAGIGPLDLLDNLSLSFLPVQLAALTFWDYQGGPLPGAVRTYLSVVGVGAPILTYWWLRGRSPRLQAAGVLAVAVLVSPIARPYALPLLLVPLVVHLGEGSAREATDEAEGTGAVPR